MLCGDVDCCVYINWTEKKKRAKGMGCVYLIENGMHCVQALLVRTSRCHISVLIVLVVC